MLMLDLPTEMINLIIMNLCYKNDYNIICKKFNIVIKFNCKKINMYNKHFCYVHENIKKIENDLLYLNFV